MRVAFFVGIVGILIAVLAYVILHHNSLNTSIKNEIIKQGTVLTGQKVTLEKVNVNLRTGQGVLKNLRVANPPGYKSPYAIAIRTLTVDFDIKSLIIKPYSIKTIHVNNVNIFAYVNEEGDSNIFPILKSVQKHTNRAKASKKDIPNKMQTDVMVKIHKIILSNMRLNITLEGKKQQIYRYTIPEIHIKNIGDKNGIYVSEVGRKIVQHITEIAVEKIQKAMVQKLKETVKDMIKNLVDR